MLHYIQHNTIKFLLNYNTSQNFIIHSITLMIMIQQSTLLIKISHYQMLNIGATVVAPAS